VTEICVRNGQKYPCGFRERGEGKKHKREKNASK
jgi:hypothetical protein